MRETSPLSQGSYSLAGIDIKQTIIVKCDEMLTIESEEHFLFFLQSKHHLFSQIHLDVVK